MHGLIASAAHFHFEESLLKVKKLRMNGHKALSWTPS